jgi:hypothetical protein
MGQLPTRMEGASRWPGGERTCLQPGVILLPQGIRSRQSDERKGSSKEQQHSKLRAVYKLAWVTHAPVAKDMLRPRPKNRATVEANGVKFKT